MSHDSPVGRICLVTGDFAGIVRNSGIGTHFLLMSRLLAARGWDVHVLYAGNVDDREAILAAPERLATQGITFSWLDADAPPAWAKIPNYGVETERLHLSQRILERLETMHAECSFDIIEFPDWDALGFRPIQAKRMGVALQDVKLAVKLHGTTEWQRMGNSRWRRSPMELKVEWCEQYAYEHADIQLSPSRYMVDWTRDIGWDVRDDAVISCPYPSPETATIGTGEGIRELAFFGRLERRKGLDLVLCAVQRLGLELPVLFMGKDTRLDGANASEKIKELLGDQARIETELERNAALNELMTGDRLAIIASTSETFGFTVAECVANRIPFIASRVGGVPEVFLDPEAQARWLFEPSTEGLMKVLERRLAADEDEERMLRDRVAEMCNSDRWNDRVEEAYRGLLERAPRPLPAASTEPPTVTIAVPHYNKAGYLPQTLRSLAAQERPADEVIVIDDGSTDERSIRVFDEEERKYPEWRFVRQENAGPGAARNACLDLATSTYFLPFDADNLATPQLVSTYLEVMQRDASLDAATCHIISFVDDGDVAEEKYVFRYSPTGGPLVVGLLQDVYGDTAAMFRTQALRAVGGFETERWSPNEDWETFVKMAVAGMTLDVVPRVLYWYRTDSGGRLQDLEDQATTHRQRTRMVETFFLDADLPVRDRAALFESLLGFAWMAHYGPQEATDRFSAWAQNEFEKAREWHESEMKLLGDHLRLQVSEVLQRAELAEARAAQLEGRAELGLGVHGAGPLTREIAARGGRRLRWYGELGMRRVRAAREMSRR